MRPGDVVVHLGHGLARFEGLTCIATEALADEFITLAFKDDARLHVPVHDAHLIAPMERGASDACKLDSLGSPRWRERRERAIVSVQEAAMRLLDNRRRRAALSRPPYEFDAAAFDEFAARFAHRPTDDQMTAIHAVRRDLRAEHPMDRVICGDTAFGKTEVAMRAAWMAAAAGRQVLVLAPTTLLAEQHHGRFERRFEGSGFRIGCLSRLIDDAGQNALLQALGTGQMDIVIGTHRLLNDDVQFERLGLAIIDEEHRFGVDQKERVAQLRDGVDVLALTATPIPRTLDMSLAGLRDISVMRTPPVARQPVKTTVAEHDETLVRESIRAALQRDEQVFYLHNRVESQPGVVSMIRKLVPAARVDAAHAQLSDTALQDIMGRFIDGQLDVLVATTIIENGLDLPNVNTILIDEAERLGLAQLHQLRGRVGRSDRPATAVLMTGPAEALSDDAKRRLQALREFDQPGAGIDLAQRDLEIRGAGELLGQDQSGCMADIGHALYARLLRRAICTRTRASVRCSDLTDVSLGTTAGLPEDYIEDAGRRTSVYLDIATAADEAALDALRGELQLDAGPLPIEACALFETVRLRQRCEVAGVTRVCMTAAEGRIEAADDEVLRHLLSSVRSHEPDLVVRHDQPGSIELVGAFDEVEARVRLLDRLLDALDADTTPD